MIGHYAVHIPSNGICRLARRDLFATVTVPQPGAVRFVPPRARASALTERLSHELEQAWMMLESKDREIEAVHDQARKLRETLAVEIQRRLQLENGAPVAVAPRPSDTARQAQNDQISQLKEALQVMGEQLEVANHRIMELSNQHTVVRGERPHLVSDNATIRRNRRA